MQNTPDRGRHAVVGVIIEDNRFLVIRRSEHVRAPGLLCFPGGGIEAGEDIPTAVCRELREELSLEVQVERHLWTNVTRWGTRLEWVLCRRAENSEPVASPLEVSEVHWLQESEIRCRSDLLGSIPDFFLALDSREFSLG